LLARGSECCSVTAVDMNGDGKPNLAVGNFIRGDVSVLLNTYLP
jgi:hypothetical protein